MRQLVKASSITNPRGRFACFGSCLLLATTASTAAAQSAPTSDSDVNVSADADAEVAADAEPTPTSEASVTSEAATTSAPKATSAPAPVPEYAGLRAHEGYHSPTWGEASTPYLTRYKPTGNQWEVTLYMGVLFPSKNHNLKVASLPVDEYSKAAVQTGFRLGYFPLSFVGAELQTFFGGGSLRESERSAIMYGVSGHLVGQLPLSSIVPFVTVGLGTLGAASETMGHDRDPAFLWGAGVKAAITKRLNGRFDFQDTMTQKRDEKNGRQTHHPALQLGVSFVFERDQSRSEKIDSDYDGLFDADDKCPSEGALTVDGCPKRVDTDSDGMFDDEDSCPLQAGTLPDGCPDLDTDKDGIPLPTDRCPDVVGVEPDGCPDLDPDKDGISGEADQCPTEPETKNGYLDADGCPDEMPEAIKRFTGVIPGILFKQGTAVIDQRSHATLDEAAGILTEYPTIQIEVSGHTSSEGSEKRNQDLSVQRAEAVRQYFIGKDIDGSRIIARGAGASEPVADNQTKEGREQNRRIEFRVLSQP